METPPNETIRLLDKILAAISSVRYGTVSVVIQDSKVIQIEKTEKVRLDKTNRETGGNSHIRAPSTRHLETPG